MSKARALFDEMPVRTLVSWTILMSGYTRHGPATETLMMFQDMVQDHYNESLIPDSFVFSIVLRACSVMENLDYGRQLHGRILKTDGAIDSFVENALVSMYANCGSLSDSSRVFARIVRPNLLSWSSMLCGYMQNGFEEEGLGLFCEMLRAGTALDDFALSMALGACANLSCLDYGVQIHCYIIKMGFDSCLFLKNSLMEFYSRCGDMDSSNLVFDKMTDRDLVSWNTVIKGHVHNLQSLEALRIFRALMDEVSNCDEYTLASILQAVTSLRELDHGREIHGYIIRAGFESNLYVISSLLDMYIECNDHERWNHTDEVPPKIFNRLKGGKCDEFIISSILKWCSLRLDIETGKMFHSQIIKLDLTYDAYIMSSLIDMYSKCGIVEAAWRVFTEVKNPGTVPWSAIIAGYCWNGWFEEALRLFQEMQFDFYKANEYTYTSVLLACLALGDITKVKELHCQILRSGYGSNVSIINTLINVYSEKWHLEHALKLSFLIPEADIAWGFLIQACSSVKDHETTHKILHRIQQSKGDIDPTSASYILESCADPVLLNVGTQAQAYITKRGFIADPVTGNSLIRMYSACGRIADSDTAFKKMHDRNSASWTSIISANVDHGHASEALELFSQIKWKNKSLESSTFTSVLKACAQKGLVDEAFHLFISMNEIYGIKPSMEHYSCLVEVMGRAGRFEDALDFIDEAIPFEPGPLIWKTLLSSCRIHNNMGVAKYAAEKLLELEPSDLSANLLLEQVLLTVGKWNEASKLQTKNKPMRMNSSWIEVKNTIYEFVANHIPAEISAKLADLEGKMEELGYVSDANHVLHNAEEEEYVGLPHTEMKALAFGLITLPHGIPIRIVKSVRMCGDCHSACKFMSTFIGRDLVIKDSCNFHHFKNGRCSCRDMW
ncbi:PREDICTED: pentatricopeptide repeat-containing protein At2g03880, mitochondrial-like [Nelumbo nucifera]|nr:PREDICTED: pentatricopeptide repeat-containing protein At2g03880, mitochondrial-like [Nelumbo nucifera]